MIISNEQLKEYQKLQNEVLKKIRFCEKHINGETIIKKFHFNALQYCSKLSFVFQEFYLILEKNFKSKEDYYFAIGELNGKVTLLLENIQIVANEEQLLYKKVQDLKVAINNAFAYLKSLN